MEGPTNFENQPNPDSENQENIREINAKIEEIGQQLEDLDVSKVSQEEFKTLKGKLDIVIGVLLVAAGAGLQYAGHEIQSDSLSSIIGKDSALLGGFMAYGFSGIHFARGLTKIFSKEKNIKDGGTE